MKEVSKCCRATFTTNDDIRCSKCHERCTIIGTRKQSDEAFWFDGILIDFNQLMFSWYNDTGVSHVFGNGHIFSENLSTLRYAAELLMEDKNPRYDQVFAALLKLHNIGINTGINFGPRHKVK